MRRSSSNHFPEKLPLIAFPGRLNPRQRSRGLHAAGFAVSDGAENAATGTSATTASAMTKFLIKSIFISIRSIYLPESDNKTASGKNESTIVFHAGEVFVVGGAIYLERPVGKVGKSIAIHVSARNGCR